MKQFMIIAIAMLAVVAFATPMFAQTTAASACVNVSVTVDPAISLLPNNCNVNVGTVTTGCFTADASFTVDANSEQVAFQVNASALYKGDDPTSSIYIPVNLYAPAYVQPSNANAILPLHPAGNYLCWTGIGPILNGFATMTSEQVLYESSQNNTFSQDVEVYVSYNQGNSQLPQGNYSGVIQLIATILPVTGA